MRGQSGNSLYSQRDWVWEAAVDGVLSLCLHIQYDDERQGQSGVWTKALPFISVFILKILKITIHLFVADLFERIMKYEQTTESMTPLRGQ